MNATCVRLPAGYPVLVVLSVDPADWYDFQRLVGDTPVSKIIGHHLHNERMIVSVACASTSVRDGLADAWD